MSVRDHVAIYCRRISRLRALGLIAIAGVLCTSACTNGSENDLVTEYSTELILTGDTAPQSTTRTLQRGVYLVEARETRNRRAHDGDRRRACARSSKIASRGTGRSIR